MNALCNGHTRFREMERSIPGITTRMLSRELKEMELNNLVTRIADEDNPNNVQYKVTGYCQTFGDILLEMIIWGKQHWERLKVIASVL